METCGNFIIIICILTDVTTHWNTTKEKTVNLHDDEFTNQGSETTLHFMPIMSIL